MLIPLLSLPSPAGAAAVYEALHEARAIRGVFGGCRCNTCHQVASHHRFGCRCWDLKRMISDPAYRDSLSMTHGLLVKPATPGAPLDFVSNAELLAHLQGGGRVYDPHGERMSLAMLSPDDGD